MVASMSRPHYFWYSTSGLFNRNVDTSLGWICNMQGWKPNDIIGIKVDCVEWKVYFYINDTIFHDLGDNDHDGFDIDPKYNYYVVLKCTTIMLWCQQPQIANCCNMICHRDTLYPTSHILYMIHFSC